MKRKSSQLLLILFLMVLQIAYATVLITQPAVTNFTKNQISYWFANFGVVHYNKPMSFSLFATNYSLCGGAEEANLKQFTSPTFIVVKEGQCSYPKKAQQAQNIGAQGIMFASKQVLYSDGNIVLADDGTGRKVRIASLFIKLQDFDKIAGLASPRIKVEFQLQQKDISSVALFLSASGRSNYVFLRNFRQYYNSLNQKITLSLAYHTIQCKGCSQNQCVLQNTCCTFDLDNYLSGMGRYIVYQQFRQYKIFKYFQANNKIDQWFEYMDRFDKRCDNDWINSEACSNRIQQQLGIKQLPAISQFDTMMQWRRTQVRTGITSLPDLSVNGLRHTESLTAQSASQMICESLINQPSSCNVGEQLPKNNKTVILVVVIISSIFFILMGIFCYRKVIRKQITNDMSAKVDQLVAKYAAKVSEQKKKRKQKLMERMTEQI